MLMASLACLLTMSSIPLLYCLHTGGLELDLRLGHIQVHFGGGARMVMLCCILLLLCIRRHVVSVVSLSNDGKID